ncbi:unnamed protein product [Amaranthus hypochondriacus]
MMKFSGHLMDNIDAGKALHIAFSVFPFNSKFELLLQFQMMVWKSRWNFGGAIAGILRLLNSQLQHFSSIMDRKWSFAKIEGSYQNC